MKTKKQSTSINDKINDKLSINQQLRDTLKDMYKVPIGDAYSNPMLSQGAFTYDPINSANYIPVRRQTWNMLELNAIERSEPIIRKGLNYKATMPFIKGIDIKSVNLNGDIITKLQDTIQDYIKPLQAIVYQGEVYGGSAGLLYIKGQDSIKALVKPLDISKVKKGDFLGIKPLERWFGCTPTGELITELGDKTGIYDAELLGQPLYFNVKLAPSQPSIKVHRSRLLLYDTGVLPSIEKSIEQYWGVSTIERIWTQLYNYNTAIRESVRALNGLNIRVVKLEDLMTDTGVSEVTRQLLEAKMEAMKIGLNNSGILFLSGEDEFDYKYATLSEVSNILQDVKKDLADAFAVPYKYLFGSAEIGDGDISENEFSGIKDTQELFVRKWYNILIPIIYRNLYGEDIPEFSFTFKKIRYTSEKEISEVINKVGTIILESYKVGAMNKGALINSLREITTNLSDVFSNVEEDYVNKVKEETYNEDQVELAFALNKSNVVSAAEQRGGDNNTKKPTPRVDMGEGMNDKG